MTAYIVICADPLNPARPDPAFELEDAAARAAGLERILLDHDSLEIHLDAERALRRAKIGPHGPALYRGWMLRSEAYGALHAHLLSKGVKLIATRGEYSSCHHLPEAYPHIARWTAQTTWLPKDQLEDAAAFAKALSPFGSAPVVIKDWVKSQAQGYWREACFILDASDHENARQIVRGFCQITGDVTGGVVFRRYHELSKIDGVTTEWRAFVLQGRILGCWPRFTGTSEPPPEGLLDEIAAALPSPFASMDLAQQTDGSWLLIEVGDGQVSSFPPGASFPEIFQAILDALK